MLPIEPLPVFHPTRPLMAWAHCLLSLASGPECERSRVRLAQLLGEVPSVNLVAARTLHADVDSFFDAPAVIRRVVEHADLDARDPQFGWAALDLTGSTPADAMARLPWELREQARFLIGCYEPVPWAAELAPIPGHYAHLSKDKAGLIAFTQDAAKGAADKQTQIKPGRYLTRFYPDLSPADVRRIVNGVSRPATLMIARTADEIEKVYREGPTSCMSRPADEYDGPCHPVRVYGDSDLALAYALPPEGSPKARALIWPERKHFGRIYGDEVLLERLLDEAGYSRGSLAGARIRRIPADPDDDVKVVMPFLDDTRSFGEVDDQWLRISGPYDAGFTCGTAHLEERPVCDRCEERCSDVVNVGGESWCDSCREHDAFASEYSGDEFPLSEECEVIVRRTSRCNISAAWAECERDEYATFCDGSQLYYHSERFEFVELSNGETWEAEYFKLHGDPASAIPPDPAPAAENDNQAAADRVAA
jgi:hypothetical protein